MTTTNLRILWCLPLLLAAGCGSPHPPAERGEADAHETGAHDRGAHTIALSPEAVESAGIVVEPASLRVLAPTVEATGRLGYDENRMAVATARIGGRVSRVVADYGARVAAGEVLA